MGMNLCQAGELEIIRVGIHETTDYILKDTQAVNPAGVTSALGLSAYGISLWW